MNKLFTKIVGVALGLTMAIGVGVAVGIGSSKEAEPVHATSTTVTVNGSASGITTTDGSQSITVSSISFGGKFKQYSTTALWFTSGSGFIYNTTDLGNIISIELAYKSGGSAASKQYLSLGTSAISSYQSGTPQITTSTGGTTGTFNSTLVNTLDTGKGFFNISISNKNLQCSSITVTYDPDSSDPEVTDWELTTGSLSVTTQPTDTNYYTDDTDSNINKEGAVIKANYWSASNHSVTKQDEVTEHVSWSLDLANSKINLSYTDEDDNTQTGSIAITVNSGTRPKFVTWDLTAASYANASADTTYWTSNYAKMTWTKNGGTNTNNYLPTTRTYSRIYNKNICTFEGLTYSSNDYGITKVVIHTCDTSNYLGLHGTDMWTDSEENTYTSVWSSDNKTITVDLGGEITDSLSATCTATTYLDGVDVYYALIPTVTPTKATVSFNEGKGTYYNGSKTATNTFSTSDVTVRTFDSSDTLAKTYSTGTGFKLTVNGNTLDATSEVKTLSFEGVSANPYVITVVVEGVGAEGANVNNSAQSPAVSLTVVAKTPESYEWTAAQTTVFYSHRDKFVIDGTLQCTFNDTAYTTGMSNYSHVIRAYDGSAVNHAGSETTLPVHNDGTLNVSSETTYVLDMWHKDYSSGLHCYTEFTVKVPTLTISDNYEGTYYVGATRTLDVTVTATFETGITQTLSSSDYELRVGGSKVTSVTPADTSSISVTATWIIDEADALTTTSPLVINPEVSTRELNEIAVSDQTLSAGSYFVLSNGAITLDVTEGGVDDLEELDQELVTITKGGKTYTSTDRIKKSDAGTYTVTYSEGEDNTVSTTFTLAVTNAVVSEISSTASFVYNKITSTEDLTNGNYLIVYESAPVAFDGSLSSLDANSNNVSVSISSGKIIGSDTINAATFAITSVDGGYTVKSSSGYYIGATAYSNSLVTSTETSYLNSIEFDDSGNVVIQSNLGTNPVTLRFNSAANTERFRYYKSGQQAIALYKQAEETIYSGSKVGYLESVIDAYRLNSGTEGSVCNADSGLYSSADWTTAKGVYAQLTSDELSEFSSTQDDFGEEGKTYNDTFLMLLSKDPAVINQSSRGVFDLLSAGAPSTLSVIVIVSLVSLTAIGGYFFLRKRKEN